MKKVLLIFALLLVIVAGVVIAQNYLKTKTFFLLKKSPTVTINGHNLAVTVADSREEQEIGLSETKSLPQNQGMIFLFEKPDYYAFWMKNMKLSIDIIYINNDKIVTIQNNAHPPKEEESPIVYTPTEPSDKVLEVQAGLAQKYDFKKGDMVKYENLGN